MFVDDDEDKCTKREEQLKDKSISYNKSFLRKEKMYIYIPGSFGNHSGELTHEPGRTIMLQSSPSRNLSLCMSRTGRFNTAACLGSGSIEDFWLSWKSPLPYQPGIIFFT